MAGLTARVIADLDVSLEEFDSNVVIVSIIQKNAIVLCSGHLKEIQTTLKCDEAEIYFAFLFGMTVTFLFLI